MGIHGCAEDKETNDDPVVGASERVGGKQHLCAKVCESACKQLQLSACVRACVRACRLTWGRQRSSDRRRIRPAIHKYT